MGKAKTSRKGKKAWRKNISTQDVDEFVEKAAREARSGGPLLDLPDDSLFFVDKSKDERLEPKRNKHRIKVLHCDSILQRNSLIAPLLEPRKRNRKRKLRDVAKPVVKGAQSNILKNPVEERNQAYDIWAKEGLHFHKIACLLVVHLIYNPSFDGLHVNKLKMAFSVM
ncbi:hypothetical protein O6H91_Y019200 [Diphasiastrum complanatum]|nr:hypothetical protein O6H91_Y019200 [Diphasiastrum complanatum]